MECATWRGELEGPYLVIWLFVCRMDVLGCTRYARLGYDTIWVPRETYDRECKRSPGDKPDMGQVQSGGLPT